MYTIYSLIAPSIAAEWFALLLHIGGGSSGSNIGPETIPPERISFSSVSSRKYLDSTLN
jgi:hypothetical protein